MIVSLTSLNASFGLLGLINASDLSFLAWVRLSLHTKANTDHMFSRLVLLVVPISSSITDVVRLL